MIKRDAFLYLEPQTSKHKKNFAQCSDCMMFTGDTCTIHGGDVKVAPTMSCGFYVEGDPMPDEKGHEMKSVTPEDSGLVDRAVRCENCKHAEVDEGECELFEELNKSPMFDLDTSIKPKGCCNAQTPKGKSIDGLRQKADSME